MTNIDALVKRVSKLESTVEPQQQSLDILKELFPGANLFLAQERNELEQLLTTISQRVVYKYGGTIDFLNTANNEELDILYRFSNLMEALRDNDQDAVQKHRTALTQ